MEAGDHDLSTAARRRALAGLAFGAMSATAYTLANVCLRQAARRDDLGWISWVTCQKALPSAVVAWGLIAWGWRRGAAGLTGVRAYWRLTLAGLLMQLGGNMVFQHALAQGGLALTVPLCFSTLIAAGALGGRLILGEAITPRTAVAMGLLIIAVIVLNQGAGAAAEGMGRSAETSALVIAVAGACLSGVCFGLGGVAIRRSVTGAASLAGTIAPLATVGVVIPLGLALQQLGTAGVSEIPASQQGAMFLAGCFNALGFFAVAAAMKRLPVIRVNLINASQAALSALAGVIWFGERPTIWIGLGTLLTVGSLAILGASRAAPRLPSPRGGE